MMKYCFSLMICCLCSALFAQFEYPSLSPKGKISQQVGYTHFSIEYERPSVRKRKIFGGLVPWNKVWRTGAAYCTKISFDTPVIFGTHEVEAGTYSLFTVPNPDNWVIILNSDTTLYGSYDYDYHKDVARFTAIPSKSSRHYETLTIDIDVVPNDAMIYISWDYITVGFEVKTRSDEQVMTFIKEELMTGKSKDADLYANAVDFFLFHDTNLLDGIELAKKAVELDPSNEFARNVIWMIYDRLHWYEEALAALETALEETRKRKYEKEEWRQNDLVYYQKFYDEVKEKLAKQKQD